MQHERPSTRGDCVNGYRPCPFAGCRYHLKLDVTSTGGVRDNFPDVEVEDLADSCALDVAELGGDTLEGVGLRMNLTRERVRQLEVDAIGKLQHRVDPALFVRKVG